MAERMIGGREFAKLWEKNARDKAIAAGTDLEKFAKVLDSEEAKAHVQLLSNNFAGSIAGDERAQAHLTAQLSQVSFKAKASAYLAMVEFREGLIETAVEVVEGLAIGAMKLAGRAIVELIRGSLASAGSKRGRRS